MKGTLYVVPIINYNKPQYEDAVKLITQIMILEAQLFVW